MALAEPFAVHFIDGFEVGRVRYQDFHFDQAVLGDAGLLEDGVNIVEDDRRLFDGGPVDQCRFAGFDGDLSG